MQAKLSDDFDKTPLSTSTPIKHDEKAKNQVHVVAMSPKLSRSERETSDSKDEVKPKKIPPVPLPKPAKTPEGPRSPTSPVSKSQISIAKSKTQNEKYQRTEDYGTVSFVHLNFLQVKMTAYRMGR